MDVDAGFRSSRGSHAHARLCLDTGNLENLWGYPVFPARLEILKNWIPRTAFNGWVKSEIEFCDGRQPPSWPFDRRWRRGRLSTSQPARLDRAALLYHLPADFFESQFVSIQAE
jgi:hypothetical protein